MEVGICVYFWFFLAVSTYTKIIHAKKLHVSWLLHYFEVSLFEN